MTVDRRLHLFADQIVGEQYIVTVIIAMENIQHVFAVGRHDLVTKRQTLTTMLVEYLVVAGSEVVTAGENNSMIFR